MNKSENLEIRKLLMDLESFVILHDDGEKADMDHYKHRIQLAINILQNDEDPFTLRIR